jgi:hypothetical protein
VKRESIGLSTTASVIGGVLGVIAFAAAAPVISEYSLMFAPRDYFLLAIMGILLVGSLSGESLAKGVLRVRWEFFPPFTAAVREAVLMAEEDLATCVRIGDHGAELIPERATVLTHCNAGALVELAGKGIGAHLEPLFKRTAWTLSSPDTSTATSISNSMGSTK